MARSGRFGAVKILLASATANPVPSAGGDGPWSQSVHLAGLATKLSTMGHQVTVASRHDAPDRPPEVWMAGGVRAANLAAGPRQPLSEDGVLEHVTEFSARLSELIEELQPDVVHAHRWVTGRAALAAAWSRRIPLVTTFHGLARSPSGDRAASEQTLVRRSAHIVAGSSSELFDLVRLGASMSDVTVAPPAVDLDVFRPDGFAEPTSRARLVALGRMTEDRRFADAIRALAAVPDAELVIVGGPDAAEVTRDEQTKRLLRVASEEGVAGRVHLRGRTRRGELAALLRSADVVLCLPSAEPSGVGPVEAMACGVPVVVTAMGPHTDVVIDGINGVHVQVGRPDQVAAAVNDLLRDDATRRAMGEAGADRARQRYGWTKVARVIEDAYLRVIDRAQSPAAQPLT